ncbi:hypothetical protein ACFE04_022820 [Oxalis oulophora]
MASVVPHQFGDITFIFIFRVTFANVDVKTTDVPLIVGKTSTENPRDCKDDDSKSNDNASTECDNNPSSDGKNDDKDDTDDSKSDDNATTKCVNNPCSDGEYDDNTSLALSKRKLKLVQRKEQEKKRKKNVKKHNALKQNVPPSPSEHLRGKNASRRWHILIKDSNNQRGGKPLFNDTFDTLLKTISCKNIKGNRVNDVHKGFLLIVDRNVPTEEAILAEEDTPQNEGDFFF